MAASLAGLYGGGFGASQEDGSGGRSGYFGRGQKNKFGAEPQPRGKWAEESGKTGSAQPDLTDPHQIGAASDPKHYPALPKE